MELHTVEQVEQVLKPAECEVRPLDLETSVVEWSQVREHAGQAALRAAVLLAGGTAQVAMCIAHVATQVQSAACRRLGQPD